MIPEDPAATALTFDGNPDTVLTHRSSVVSDVSGSRSCTMVFTGDNRAYSVDAGGNTIAELTTVTVRATEYATEDSMPAKLPPTSAYTYCAELQVDGAERVRFEKPVALWVENFLGFDVGIIVPVGYYDRDRGVWVPQPNGRVVRLLDTDGDSVADALDADGDGQADDLNGNGSFADEVAGLDNPQKYPAGASFWRVEVKHFSPFDFNWAPSVVDQYLGTFIDPNPLGDPEVDDERKEEDDCSNQTNSYATHRARTYHEDIPVPGTELTLHYASSRVQGTQHIIAVPASGNDVLPDSLRGIVVKLEVAGRVFKKMLPPLPNQGTEFVWDGLDCLGRRTASAIANTSIGFIYETRYAVPEEIKEAFASLGLIVTPVGPREEAREAIAWKHHQMVIRSFQVGEATSMGEGWSLSNHHQADWVLPVLHKGDGTILEEKNSSHKSRSFFYSSIIDTVAGNGTAGYGGDGGAANHTEVNWPTGVAVDAKGDLYIADSGNCRVRKVDSYGIITTVAGNGSCGYSGDGGAAVEAQLGYPAFVAVDSRENLYISDTESHRIRKVGPDGVITTVAGSGLCHLKVEDGYGGYQEYDAPCFDGDQGPADQAKLNNPSGVATDASGNLYIADTGNRRLRKVAPSGTISTVAGDGELGSGADGWPSTQLHLSPVGVVADSRGNLFVSDLSHGEGNGRIRKIDPTGFVTTVAGHDWEGTLGDGGPATQAYIGSPRGLAVDRGGNLYFADPWINRVRAVNTMGIITTVAGSDDGTFGEDGGLALRARLAFPMDVAVDPRGDLYATEQWNQRVRKVRGRSPFVEVKSAGGTVVADDNGLGYALAGGRHRETVDLDTGALVYKFDYDEGKRLSSITDRFGNRTTLARNADGVPTAIVSPDGHTTGLVVDDANRLREIIYPDGGSYRFEYNAGGLMTVQVQQGGNRFEHGFDAAGKLTDIIDEEGGHWRYSQKVTSTGEIRAEMLTGEGNLTSYVDKNDGSGIFTSTITDPNGAATFYRSFPAAFQDLKWSACGLLLEFRYDYDPQYGFRFTRQLREHTTTGFLDRITERYRTYEDTDSNGVPDRITETVAVNGKATTLVHDTVQHRKTLTSPQGRTVTSFYDPHTLLTTDLRVPGYLDKSFGYDTRGRPTSIVIGERETKLAYDDQGRLGSVTDPGNRTTSYAYDAVGRTTGVSRPDGSTIGFSYDLNGNITVLANPAGTPHAFGYNRVNLNGSYQTPLSGSYLYSYDRDRRLTRVLFPSGKEIRNVYEKANLARVETPEGNIEYGYLCSGRFPESINRGGEGIAYGYDGPLVTSETFSGTLGGTLKYSYDEYYRVTLLSYAGATESHTYDNDGLLTGTTDFTIRRDATSGFAEAVLGATTAQNRAFNGYGELDGVEYRSMDNPVHSWSVSRSAAGRIATKTETVNGSTVEYAYEYDSLGRLLAVRRDGVPAEEYRYDANGNRTQETNTLLGIIGRTSTYSEEDHLLTSGGTVYRYDADGFLTTRTEGSAVTRYVYSSRGELLSVTLPDGKRIEYVNDPLGRRIAKKVNGTITQKYLWQGRTRLLAVFGGNDDLILRFRYADGRMPLSFTKGGTEYSLSYDQVGTLRTVTDASGAVVKELVYDSFGNLIGDTNPGFYVPFGFAGGLHDPDTGLVRFGFRDYDPEVGRWTAKDPIGFGGGDTNLYGYCLSDPINWVDSHGLKEHYIFEFELLSTLFEILNYKNEILEKAKEQAIHDQCYKQEWESLHNKYSILDAGFDWIWYDVDEAVKHYRKEFQKTRPCM
ncbi:NHL repeat containing protein [Syntrophobacter fumaroxidans MPOB]|uniref:NHL repeat containing protein n=2 Tax=Syntrophobacter TaxID=29526 RepID=A0LQM7_SYNFM|nr:NHL repeat containing protein [Syntrophobacter fumaroxidans MPOB]